MNKKGFLILESSESYSGRWLGGKDRAGEVVFNTSHCGYEEIATDPSYFSQIMVMTAPMQGNYGSRIEDSESSQPHIQGFIALEIQNTKDNSSWKTRLENSGIPLLDSIDTRKLVLRLRESGTPWGALIQAENLDEARGKAKGLIDKLKAEDSDWVWAVSRKSPEEFKGNTANGPRVALLDYGAKQNIIRELQKTCSAVKVFPSRATAKEIQAWEPNGIMLSNGPGDPDNVKVAVQTIKDLLGWRPIFGICMGHQLLSLALGGKTYKLKFGHRGGNHPVKDHLINQVYMTSQNHGYAVDEKSFGSGVKISHVNLYDGTVEGIECLDKKCMSVQFHPESHPGPREAAALFDVFTGRLK